MASELSKEYINEFVIENAQFGVNLSYALEGIDRGWKSYFLRTNEANQVHSYLKARNNEQNPYRKSMIHGRFFYYINEITEIAPDDINRVLSEGEVITIIPFDNPKV